MLSPSRVPVSVLDTVLVRADVRMELTMQREQVIGKRSNRKSSTWLIWLCRKRNFGVKFIKVDTLRKLIAGEAKENYFPS